MPISGIRSSECGNRNGCTSEAASDFWCLEPACIEAAVSRFLTSDFPIPVLRRPGGYSGEPKPDPIPNSAVKLSCANGTKSRRLGRVGRCQACQGQEKIRLRILSSSRSIVEIERDSAASRHRFRRPLAFAIYRFPDISASSRLRNAFGFSANSRSAILAAAATCVACRAAIAGFKRARQRASGRPAAVRPSSTPRS